MVRPAESIRDDSPSLDQPLVWQEITRAARAALREAAEADAAAPPVRARVRSPLPGGETWEVRAQSLLQAANEQPVIVVAVERIGASADGGGLPADREVDDLRHRFGLSPRQAEVAALLARRMSNKEIATRLGVAHNTARRHVELVMMRLRVHNRAEVAGVLAGDDRELTRAAGVRA